MNPIPGADPLAEAFRGIREPRQRALKLVGFLKDKPPAEIAAFLMDLVHRSNRRARSAVQLHLDLVRNRDLLFLLGYEILAAVYAEAHDRGWTEVQALLRSDRMSTDEWEQKPETFASRLDTLTLGERKQAGRNAKRAALEALLFDPDPMVIRELLLNPHLTERDVLRIATRHKAPPSVLEEVLRSDKWIAAYRVRKALVFNPNTPLSYASGLVSHLQKKDLLLLMQIRPNQTELLRIAKKKLEEA